MSNIIVIAEARSGQVKKPSLEAVGAAVELAAKSGGQVIAIVAGNDLDAAKDLLANSGAHKVIAVQSADLANYSGTAYANAITAQINSLDAGAILMPHSAMGRDLAPRVAALLGAGMVSDATELHFEEGQFGATKPVYAGKAFQKSMSSKTPFMATLRPNNWEATSGSGAEVTDVPAEISADDLRAIVKDIVAGATDAAPLQEAKVVVAAGRGLKEEENFKLIEDLAAAFGPGVAAIGASRAIVDSGWRPHSEQVGQTGKVVAPTLYIAIGISGAIQHIAGMSTSRYIVAINKDENAPIFKLANYGIVGDALEIVPALTEAIKAAVAH